MLYVLFAFACIGSFVLGFKCGIANLQFELDMQALDNELEGF